MLQLEFICIHLLHLNMHYNFFYNVVVIASFAGPHFVEYLGFAVTAECDVLLKCKVKQKEKKKKQNKTTAKFLKTAPWQIVLPPSQTDWKCQTRH